MPALIPAEYKPKPLPPVKDYGANAIEVTNLTFSYDTNAPCAILTTSTLIWELDRAAY